MDQEAASTVKWTRQVGSSGVHGEESGGMVVVVYLHLVVVVLN